MINKNDILLLLILITYIIPIFYVFNEYKNNPSISNIICDDKNKYIIFFSMVIMGFFTILYELNRSSTSLICIILLLFGICGVIFIYESLIVHYFFALIVFSSIMYFMYYYCKCINDFMLHFTFMLQINFIMLIVSNLGNNFFGEVFFILNFAAFYLLLHFYTRKNGETIK